MRKKSILTRGLFVATIVWMLSGLTAGSSAAGEIATGTDLSRDNQGAKMTRLENLDNYRYCEIFMISKDPASGDMYGIFYNTTDRNGGAETHDSCSDEIWAKVDREALTTEYKLAGVFKNGPRFWMYDWIELPVGAERNFDGVHARWMGKVKLPPGFGEKDTAYHFTTVQRKSHQGYKKGQRVFILDDPEGTTWVMQAYSRIVDPSLSYDDLMTLDKKLKLPEGWKYRSAVLEKDLVIGAINGVARVVQDNLQSTYNACFEVDGQKNCTFVP